MSDPSVNPQKVMDTSDILALLPVGERQLRNLLNDGVLPSQGKGKTRTFCWPDVLEAWVEYKIALAFRDGNAGNEDADSGESISETGGNGKADVRALTRRKLSAEAQLKELALSREQGKVVPIADAVDKLNRMFGNLRAQLLGMAPKLASRLEAERDRTSREAALKDELENLCRELSTGKIVDLPPEDPDPETLELSAAADPLFDYGVPGEEQ